MIKIKPAVRADKRVKLIGVIGSGEPDSKLEGLSQRVGELIAGKGYGLINGGLCGVMQGSAKGAKAAGGITVGLLPGLNVNLANPYIDIIIPTGMGEMRNALIVRAAAVLIAIGGGYGTLSEIALAHKAGKPVIGLQTWDVTDKTIQAQSPEQAVDEAVKCLAKHSAN